MQALNDYGDKHYNGEAVVTFLTDYADWSIYIAALYLAFVFWGPYYIEKLFQGKQNVKLIKRMWGLWNIGLSVFSLYGSIIIAPTLINNFRTMGTKKTLCEYRADEVVSSKIGFAMGMFAISKIFEFGDTFFLLMAGSKNLRFMSWFHHVTIFLYSWYAYQQKSTIFIIIASMNYPVHTIMYLYFAFSEFGLARFVKPFAKYITIMQICQMIGGITMTAIAQYHKWQDDVHDACPGATWAMCRGQNMIYIANLYLFSEMFLNAYVWKKVEAKKDRKAQ